MNKQTYTIKPLEWRREFSDYQQAFIADCHGITYTVIRYREDCEPSNPWMGWKWHYSLDERSDQSADCKNSKDGKASAEADWLERIRTCLDEA